MILTLVSAGAKIVPVGSEGINHVIVDKPVSAIEDRRDDREYIQPQWVLDSFNESLLLSVSDFAPGVALPAHLSPFAAGDAEYLPQRRQFLDSLKLQAQRRAQPDNIVSDDAESELLKGIDEEMGKTRATQKRPDPKIEAEEREKAVMMLSKKHRRLLDKIEGSKKTKRVAADKLRERAAPVEQ